MLLDIIETVVSLFAISVFMIFALLIAAIASGVL